MFSFFRKDAKFSENQNKVNDLTDFEPSKGPPPAGALLAPFGMPLNELDFALVAKHETRIGAIAFLDILLHSQVHVVTREDQVDLVDGGFKLKKAPFLFTQIINGQHHLGVFTHELRGGIVPMLDAQFDCSIPLPFMDLLVFFGQNPLGFVINPYFEMNMSWDSDKTRKIIDGLR